eukprot:Phypoly_transcript_15395.p1 GENE.Phypoly_transcript_15395~~Phypoly_transcript_15395.p1  ORF type:complete len:254 (+),score=25.07 Phypoly_transcript_15395:145-906(+)
MGIWYDMDDDAYFQKNKHIKKVLMGMNVLLWIFGILLIILGAYSLYALKEVRELVSISLPSGLIVLGVFFFILTNVGCYSTHKERSGGLILYTLLMLLLLICLIGVGGGLFTYRSEIAEKFGNAWRHASEDARNTTQTFFQCCGWSSANDFPAGNCSHIPGLDSDGPCKDKIVEYGRKYVYVAGVAAIVIGIIEFISVIVAAVFVVRVSKNPKYALLDRNSLQNKKQESGFSGYFTKSTNVVTNNTNFSDSKL